MTTKREFRTVGAAMMAEARKTGRASLRGIVGGAMMAAVLVLGMTACSSENDLAGEPKTVEEPTAQTQATVIHVTVGAGISDGATRSTVDYTGGTRTLQFTTGDKLYVWGKASRSSYASGAEYYGYVLAGMLALDAIDPDDPTKATFSGDLSVYEALVDGDYDDGTGDWNVIYSVTYPDANRLDYLPYFISSDDPLSSCDYVRATLIHEGTESQVTIDDYKDISLPTYDCAATVEALMTTGLVVSGSYNAGMRSFALTKDTAQPIVNCTIAGLEGSTDYQFVLKKGAAVATSVEWTTDGGGTVSFAFISRESGSAEWSMDVTKGGSTVGTVSIGQKVFEGKVYNVSRLWTSSGFVKTRVVDLSEKTDGYGAENGDILTGTMPSNKALYIANGATVILRDATVNCSNNNGITCADATIILSGENTVSGKNSGIYIGPGTLTIQGSGSLTATATDTNTNALTGIGGYNNNCNLVIKGGTIVAQGGTASNSNYSGAGIGSRVNGQFGTITIEGGDVRATGGANAAGIGCGSPGSCGDITISGGTVRAMGGSMSGSGIGGTGDNGWCGNITISGGTVTATSNSAETPAIGNSSTDYGTCVTITSGITSVAMTNSVSGNFPQVGIFLRDKSVCIDGVTITNFLSTQISSKYGSLRSRHNSSTNTWTLYK